MLFHYKFLIRTRHSHCKSDGEPAKTAPRDEVKVAYTHFLIK